MLNGILKRFRKTIGIELIDSDYDYIQDKISLYLSDNDLELTKGCLVLKKGKVFYFVAGRFQWSSDVYGKNIHPAIFPCDSNGNVLSDLITISTLVSLKGCHIRVVGFREYVVSMHNETSHRIGSATYFQQKKYKTIESAMDFVVKEYKSFFKYTT
jgi:hypothetical protein